MDRVGSADTELKTQPLHLAVCTNTALTRQAIEKEITDHLGIVAVLKRRLNTLAPISRLPPELLAAIFVLIATQYENSKYLVQFTHVCSHWRDTALAFPRVWCHIVLPAHPMLLDELLARSKDAPLIINVRYITRYGARADSEPLALTMKHLERVKELRISAPSEVLHNIWQGSNSVAPLLEILHVRNDFSQSESSSHSSKLHLPILHPTSVVPLLRRLEVEHFPNCGGTFPATTSLRHLSIRNKKHGLARVELSKLLSQLEKMPALETLLLDDAFQVTPGACERIFSLSRLRSLNLSATTTECANALTHLQLPPTTRLEIYCQGQDMKDFSEALAGTISHPDRRPWRSLHVYRLRTGTSYINLYEGDQRKWFAMNRDHEALPWGKPEMAVRFANAPNTLVTICKTLPLSNVQSLFVSGTVARTAGEWLQAFGKMDQLSTVWVQHEAASASLARALRYQNSMQQQDGTGGIEPKSRYFSSLRVLKLEGVHFKTRDEVEECILGNFGWALLDCLKSRADNGIPLSKLILRERVNTLKEEDIEKLKKYVETLDWDEWLEGYEFSDEEEEEEGDYYSSYDDEAESEYDFHSDY
ncbi:uncharacterized protein FIBRA_03138 [Fibroporia radiculosa]|uniref:Uncharacterized protein n=1 Tax=Fibroporia radiculosa TaxID=599839 RepID=J4GNB3_9APHY|nr:uncharacterized protein FIBRA_03138 [Fibroporia radiculosa]CCM01090.1 predicted protein [Fibroporia radiculosa]